MFCACAKLLSAENLRSVVIHWILQGFRVVQQRCQTGNMAAPRSRFLTEDAMLEEGSFRTDDEDASKLTAEMWSSRLEAGVGTFVWTDLLGAEGCP
jgi:hypothetical protein